MFDRVQNVSQLSYTIINFLIVSFFSYTIIDFLIVKFSGYFFLHAKILTTLIKMFDRVQNVSQLSYTIIDFLIVKFF